MKFTNTLFALFFVPLLALAQQDPVYVDSEIDAVTVFSQGAQVTRTASVNLPKGTSTLVFQHLTQNMDPSSIQLKGTGNLLILSISNRQNYLGDEDKSPEMIKLEKQIEVLAKDIRSLAAEEDAYRQEKEMILANKQLSGQNSAVSVEQLKQTAAFFSSRILAINLKMDEIRQSSQKKNKEKQKLERQLASERTGFQKKSSQVLVNVDVKQATTANFRLSYQVHGASWKSTYDARVVDLKKPIQLMHKAVITQQTGEDWDNVDLVLNTGSPFRSGQIPHLGIWYIDFANVAVLGSRELMKKDAPTANADRYYIQGRGDKAESGFNNQSFQVSQNLTSEEYTVDRRQNIPSTGKPQTVVLRELDIPAQYEYHIKPRLDKDAFLIANIYNWDQYDLLDGEMSLYNRDTYVGKSYLNTKNPRDTMEISLGRDNNIIVSRKRVKDKTEKTFLGGKRVDVYKWKIHIRNGKKEDISVILKEPIPVSRNEDIKVTHHELSGGRLHKETGILKWDFKLSPNKEKEFTISYEIKYPKDKNIRL